MQLKAAIYARTSADDAEDRGNKVSIAEQLAQCRLFAKEKGFEVVLSAEDRDRSGRTYPKIPEAEKQLALDSAFNKYFDAHIRRESKRYRLGLSEVFKALPRIDVIIVHDPTRLMRPLFDSQLYSFLKQRIEGKRLICVEGGELDFERFADRISSTLNWQIQDETIKVNLEKAKASLTRKRNSGWLTFGKLGFGFENSGHQKVSIVDSEAELVRRIFTEFVGGKTLTRIAKDINLSGSEKFWTVQELHKILKRPTYAAMQWDVHKNLIPSKPLDGKAIVSEAIWRKAQDRLKMHRNAGVRIIKGIVHPLIGIAKCGFCGGRMATACANNFDKSEYVTYYQCARHYLGAGDGCKDTRVREWGNLRQKGLCDALAPLCYQGYAELLKEQTQDVELIGRKKELEEKLDACKEHDVFLSKAKRDGKISSVRFLEMLAENEGIAKGLEADLETLNKKLDSILIFPKMDNDFFMSSLIRLKPEPMRQLAAKVFKDIRVLPYHVEIELQSGESFSIERIPDRSTRKLPPYALFYPEGAKVGKGKLTVVYCYKSADNLKVDEHSGVELARTKHLIIRAAGENPKPFELQIKKKRRPGPLKLPDYLQSKKRHGL